MSDIEGLSWTDLSLKWNKNFRVRLVHIIERPDMIILSYPTWISCLVHQQKKIK